MRIAIIGAGIGGLTFARALLHRGFSNITVYEQAPSLRAVGAGIQLSPNATRILDRLDVLDALRPHAVQPSHIVAKHYQTGTPIMRGALGATAEAKYHAPYLHAHRHDLHRVLLHATATMRGVTLKLGARLLSLDDDGSERVTLRFADGRIDAAELVVGADGLHTVVAKGQGRDVPFSGFVAYRGTVPVRDVPVGIERAATVYWGPGKHFVHYLVSGARVVNWVGVVEQNAAVPESWSRRAPENAADDAFRDFAPAVRTIIAKTKAPMCWGLYERAPHTLHDGDRIALLGDAAHPMLPFLAQGAAMAIEDAWALADELFKHTVRGTTNAAPALSAYAARRTARCQNIVHLSRRNAKLFHLKSAPMQFARNSVFRLMSRFAPDLLSRPYDHVYAHNEIAMGGASIQPNKTKAASPSR